MNQPSKPTTTSTAWENLKKALAHCDKCDKFVSDEPWSVCPYCGYDIWDDFEDEDDDGD